jgi:hypothetical protein
MKNINVSLEISKDSIANLLCSAFEGKGIGYWARIVEYKEPTDGVNLKEYNTSGEDGCWNKNVIPYIHYPLSKDGYVLIEDFEENRVCKLNLEAIEKGLTIFISKHGMSAGQWLSENFDASTADVFVQCCLFGDVIYG